MDSERILPAQTVLVHSGVIEQIGSTGEVQVPHDAVIVDGQGKYLMPGLMDMHVHIMFENDLLLWVANGVTSVRNMWGHTGKMLWFGFPDHLVLREQTEQGTLLGPTIYTAGPTMEGSPSFCLLAEVFDTPEAARASVAWQKAQGYDFVKVYDHLSPEVYQAILEAARERDMPVVGYVPLAIGLENVLAGGQQTIEHLSGVMARGPWLPRGELQSMSNGLKDSFEPSLLERLWPLALCLLAAFAAIRVFRRSLA